MQVASTQGGRPHELLRVQEPESLKGWALVGWAPDGRYILFAKADQQGKTQIGKISAEGGEPRYFDLGMDGIA